MVDAEDLSRSANTAFTWRLSSLAESRSWPKGFSITARTEPCAGDFGEAVAAQVFNDWSEIFGRGGQVKQPVAADSILLGNLVQSGFQTGIRRAVVKVHGIVIYLFDETFQMRVVRRRSAKLKNAGAHVGGKLIAQRPTGHANNRELLRQQSVLLQVK